MLVGQNLGGSHKGRLLSIRDGEQHGKRGDDQLQALRIIEEDFLWTEIAYF